ncbi:alpha/beta fold hydrolase [Massilia terrae]|uniref:Alpha/beta fold hydrolase n=1 Tax=Massilia terrae TaxID=1811224 RepID=A0ABT2D449_9BURK|nr:alpha/beta fold hydrolase [Massilia terrae]MCS0661018.1 alpha/beta fold hydrolase [Massilia terrae]
MDTARPRRLRTFLIAALAAVAAILVAVPYARNRESLTLDDAARKQAPGQFVRLSHGMVHYRVAGPADGAPVVLVHGFSVPDYAFDATRSALAGAGFRAISFDLYGRGWSDRPDVRYDRDLFAGELGELMDALHLQKARLVGLSMGGAVVGHFAAAHPERVQRLVLVAPFNQPRDIGVMAWPGVGEWLARSWFLPDLASSQTEDFPHPEKLPGWSARFEPQMRYDGFGRAILSTIRNTTTQSSIPDFEAVGRAKIPVELVWGERDTTVPYAEHALVQQAIPQARFVSLTGLGHMTVVEDPDAVNPHLVSFLREN